MPTPPKPAVKKAAGAQQPAAASRSKIQFSSDEIQRIKAALQSSLSATLVNKVLTALAGGPGSESGRSGG